MSLFLFYLNFRETRKAETTYFNVNAKSFWNQILPSVIISTVSKNKMCKINALLNIYNTLSQTDSLGEGWPTV